MLFCLLGEVPGCKLERDILMNSHRMDILPVCDSNGWYHPKQCSYEMEQCWCVDKLTGAQLPGTKQPILSFTKDCYALQGILRFGFDAKCLPERCRTLWCSLKSYCQQEVHPMLLDKTLKICSYEMSVSFKPMVDTNLMSLEDINRKNKGKAPTLVPQ